MASVSVSLCSLLQHTMIHSWVIHVLVTMVYKTSYVAGNDLASQHFEAKYHETPNFHYFTK